MMSESSVTETTRAAGEETPLVSLVVPVYNVEKFLDECVGSLVQQTLQNIEIICVDDGSTDGSSEILRGFAKRDKRVRVLPQENSGYGVAMNRGIAAATGEYIGIVESDDWADPEMFEQLYKIASTYQVDVCKSAFYHSFTVGEVRDELYNELPERLQNTVVVPRNEQELFWYQPSVWSAIYRREFLRENEISFTESPGAAYQDTGFSMKVLCAAQSYYYLPTAWLHYRSDNPESSVRSRAKVYAVSGEMADARAYAREHLSGADRQECLAQLWSISFGLDVWNLKRIDPSFREEYLASARETFSIGETKGEIDRSRFPRFYRLVYPLMRRIPGLFLALVGLLPKSGIRSKARKAKQKLSD